MCLQNQIDRMANAHYRRSQHYILYFYVILASLVASSKVFQETTKTTFYPQLSAFINFSLSEERRHLDLLLEDTPTVAPTKQGITVPNATMAPKSMVDNVFADLLPVSLPTIKLDLHLPKGEIGNLNAMVVESHVEDFFNDAFQAEFTNEPSLFSHVEIRNESFKQSSLRRILYHSNGPISKVTIIFVGMAFFKHEPLPTTEGIHTLLTKWFGGRESEDNDAIDSDVSFRKSLRHSKDSDLAKVVSYDVTIDYVAPTPHSDASLDKGILALAISIALFSLAIFMFGSLMGCCRCRKQKIKEEEKTVNVEKKKKQVVKKIIPPKWDNMSYAGLSVEDSCSDYTGLMQQVSDYCNPKTPLSDLGLLAPTVSISSKSSTPSPAITYQQVHD
uniref:Uncharacterized protein n=1 Tax=Ditylum brightwellii TaxID=49249 RepID=A0A7S4QLK8_9STRA